MATGLYVLHDGSVVVAYGHRQIPISCAQYKANGYKPPMEELTVTNALTAQKSRVHPLDDGASRGRRAPSRTSSSLRSISAP
jgi:hypothetical protein